PFVAVLGAALEAERVGVERERARHVGHHHRQDRRLEHARTLRSGRREGKQRQRYGDGYHGTLVSVKREPERIQCGVRLEKNLVKVLKGLAEYLDISLAEV